MRLLRLDGEPPIEGVRADGTRHAFPRHQHAEFALGLVLSGAKEFEVEGRTYKATAGSIFVIRPGATHTGRAVGEARTSYLAWFVPPDLWPRCDMAGPAGRSARIILDRPEVRSRMLAFHGSVERRASLIESQSRLQTLLGAIVRGHAEAPTDSAPGPGHRPGIARALEYLEGRSDGPVHLDEIARVAGLSRFHFLRAFRSAVGLPPHAYLDSIRVRKAKAMLLAGRPIAEVAVSVGYSDQAHLTRRFKRLTGLTPGQVLGGRKIVQDRRRDPL